MIKARVYIRPFGRRALFHLQLENDVALQEIISTENFNA